MITTSGRNFIDLFIKSIDSIRPSSGKRVVNERDANILLKCYDFDNNVFPTYKEVAKLFGISGQRISELHKKSLKRLGGVGRHAKCNVIPCMKLMNYLSDCIKKTNGADEYDKLINFWHLNLPDFNGRIMIRLLSTLLYPKKNDIKQNKDIYKKWEKDRFEAEKKRLIEEGKIAKIQDNLLNNVIWFENRGKENSNVFSKPQRQVNTNTEYKSGELYSTKCNRKVQYESGLELNFIYILENSPKVKYYLEQPITIQYGKYHYTPDFVVILDNDEVFITEIKDFSGMVDYRTQRKIEALIDYCKTNGYGIILTNGKDTINKLFFRDGNYDFEKELIEMLNQKEIMYYSDYKNIERKYNFLWTDFLVVVLRNNLRLYSYQPFRLFKENNCDLFRKTMIQGF